MPFLIAFLIIFIIFLICGVYFAYIVIFPKCFTSEETYEIEKSNGKIIENEFLCWEKETINIQSPFGYQLFGYYFPIPNSKHSIIFSHGITFSLFGSVKYMKIFRDLGFNILVYDLRNHGKSGGKNTTFGFFEKHDLKAVTSWLIEKIGGDAIIGTHGESLGAATTLMHAAIDTRIHFVIEDCGYSNLKDLLKFRLKQDYNLPAFPFIHLASLMSKLFTGMCFNAVKPYQEVKKIHAPVLFIHGVNDDFIPTSQVYVLHENKLNGPKKLYIAPNAAHAEAFWNNQEAYTHVVNEFLKENNLI